jgi:hypothetical protein
VARRRRSPPAGAEPLSAGRKWRAILLATLLLAPAFWSILTGMVAAALPGRPGAPRAAPAIALGLALVPFVFLVLAFLSQHPRAPGAVLRAMALALLVGIPVSALAGDGVTGLVAGAGAGGAAALRAHPGGTIRARALAVAATSAYVFVVVRFAPDVALLVSPALPFTALGVADHLAEGRRARAPGEG